MRVVYVYVFVWCMLVVCVCVCVVYVSGGSGVFSSLPKLCERNDCSNVMALFNE